MLAKVTLVEEGAQLVRKPSRAVRTDEADLNASQYRGAAVIQGAVRRRADGSGSLPAWITVGT